MESNVDNANKVIINATMLEQVTFASQQNDVAVISELVIQNNTDEVLVGLKLQLHAEPSIIQSRSWTIDRLNPQAELRIQKRSVQLSADVLQKLTERMTANVSLQLFQRETEVASLEHKLVVLARNEWGGANYMPELLAAFVTPNDPRNRYCAEAR